MKRIINFIVVTILVTTNIVAQDSLTAQHLKPFTHTFDVTNGKLSGEGKAFLEAEMAKAQYTMIGEYHGSKRISEFTNAIIPLLHNLNYKAMAFEVGPVTGEQLNNLNGNVEDKIKQWHQKYIMRDADGDAILAFPFFDYKEDAQFLQRVKDNSWSVFGIDQEYYDSYIMLADMMYNNLSNVLKKQHKELYTKTIAELRTFYKNDQNDKQNLHVALSNSEVFQKYLKTMESQPNNIEIIEALKHSSAIYLLYNNRKWYENNATRISYMKSLLRKGLERLDFDLAKDKLLIKMGGYHLSKGFSPLSLYEVGNTLNELAEYHGNTALNIGFMQRYYKDGDEIVDNFLSKNRYYKSRKALLEVGQKDQWVVIDLRPLIKRYFYYPQKFKLNKNLEELVQRYDLLVIPKIEVKGIINY
ncbi:hypothetical protein RM697_02875 [Ichthyenterobacterium sp. W332]|uniref:Erythromycin esterase n=1 Tax=Microcosmobacter mediterraneus TaxID=3075607 RepID=A0ABU2YI67_9FLAO|nr:hypothetical protein [Ichthyenterobacterium sp. W332]MDT0557576.1 hypothetical protein [Ichthyenterobacterium sp. W332]